MEKQRDRQITLSDGRKLGYREYGSHDGTPLFYLHGAPSARVELELFVDDALLHSLGVRLIAPDRPGVGLSDFQPSRRLLDWPADVVALAEHLGIERFAVLAYSLGGPYGLACAFAIPERLTRVGIVSGSALFTELELMENVNEGTRRYLTLPRERPRAARLFLWALGASVRLVPGLAVANAAAVLPEPDREVVSRPEVQKGFVTMVREAMRQGTRGAFHESLLAVTDWGFHLEDIHVPVLLWHGEEDRNVPVAMARHAARVLPDSELTTYPNEGHLSLFKKYMQEIIRTLVQ